MRTKHEHEDEDERGKNWVVAVTIHSSHLLELPSVSVVVSTRTLYAFERNIDEMKLELSALKLISLMSFALASSCLIVCCARRRVRHLKHLTEVFAARQKLWYDVKDI